MEKFATTTTNKEILAGIFNNKESAAKAFIDLEKSGYSTDEINVVMSKDTELQFFGKDVNRFSFGEGKIGRIKAWISSSGMVGIGPMIASLNASAHMIGKAAIRGMLIAAGLPVELAGRFNEGLKNGKILLTVNPKNDDDLEYISYKWNQYLAEEVYS